MDIKDFNRAGFFKGLEKSFEISSSRTWDYRFLLDMMASKSQSSTMFGMYLGDGRLYELRYNNSSEERELDVEILHNIIIEDILGISRTAVSTGKVVNFITHPEKAMANVDKKKAKIAFFVNPTPADKIFKRAQEGERMPQKSTYFYPKVLSGLVFYRFAE